MPYKYKLPRAFLARKHVTDCPTQYIKEIICVDEKGW